MQLPSSLSSVRLRPAQRREGPQDVPDTRRREGVAGRRDSAAQPRQAGRALAAHAARRSGGVARRSEGRAADDPHALRAPYKPAALRGYEADLRRYVLDDLGAHRLSDVRRGDLQALVDRLLGKGLSSSRSATSSSRCASSTGRDRARRGHRESDHEPAAAERRQAARPGGIRNRGGGPSLRSPRGRAPALGHRLLRGPSPRRAARTSLGRRRSRARDHPRSSRLGRRRRRDRAEVREGHAHGADHRSLAGLPHRAENAHRT